MPYATPEQFVKTFSEREAISLTDEERTGQVNTDKLTFALTRASQLIDGYLVGRYAVPWLDSAGVLIGYCCDIARYQLTTDYRQLDDEIRMRYSDAISFLEKVASGKVNLGKDSNGKVIQSSSRVRLSSGSRQFGRESTRGGAF